MSRRITKCFTPSISRVSLLVIVERETNSYSAPVSTKTTGW